MAHHKATKKAIRQSAKRNALNRSYKSRMKTAIKQVESAANEEERQKKLKSAQRIIDRVAQKKIVSKKSASRKISKLTKGPQKA